MASLLALCLIAVSILTIRTEAQLSNVTLQVRNSTEVEPIVNLTSTVKAELPPGGLPEVIVELTEGATSTAAVPVAVSPPAPVENPQVAAKQMNEGGGHKTLLVVDPDAISIKVIGSRCTVSKDCSTLNNTSCISGICDCISGFIPSKHSLDKCLKVPKGLDDACEEEAQCAHVVPASECRGGKCSCPPNYVFDLGRCWEKQWLGGVCNTSVQCDSVAFSICAQGVCACQTPLIPNPNSNKCLQIAGTIYRAPCVEDIQCTDSYGDEAHCSNSQCICTNNYHFNGTSCVPDKKLGEICVSDVECAVSDVNNVEVEGSRTCISQVCDCAVGFTVLQGEDICMEKSSGEELAVSFTWITCIVIAKYYLS